MDSRLQDLLTAHKVCKVVSIVVLGRCYGSGTRKAKQFVHIPSNQEVGVQHADLGIVELPRPQLIEDPAKSPVRTRYEVAGNWQVVNQCLRCCTVLCIVICTQ